MGSGRSGGESLIDELSRHKGKTVMLGVRSSFFFIGPSEEAIADIRIVGIMAHVCVAISMNKRPSKSAIAKVEDIGKRRVVKTYVRNPDDGGDEIVILVEGSEFGSFWSRDEYLAGRRALLSAMK